MKIKKFISIITTIFILSALGGAVGCSSDSSSSSSDGTDDNTELSEKITNDDGTTTLNIQENGSGFVSTTGSINTTETKWIGYSNGFIENLTSGTSVVYTVLASEAINDAKIAIHYANWQNTNTRGAYVYVNGTLVNDNNPISMTYTNKGTQGQVVDGRWIDSGYLTGVSLNQGNNSIVIEGAPADTYTTFVPTANDTANSLTSLSINNDGQLSNIDYLIVVGKGIDFGTDKTPYYTLSYSSENTTAGTVASETSNGSVREGTSVTLTATANDGWKFECWTDGTTSNPYTFTVSGNKYVMAHFVPSSYSATDKPVGYASVTSDEGNAYTITGGAGASSSNTVTISSYTDLTSTYASLISGDEPAIITISGTISTAEQSNPLYSVKVNVGSNKTIYGDTTSQGRLRNIELNIEGENIIVRNMMLGEVIGWDGYTKSGGDDAMCLNGATHVWIDHCEFQSHLTPQDLDGNEITSGNNYYSTNEDWAKDFYDGLLDIKNGSTWITISNCYFHDHWKAVLCASGDGGPDTNTTTGATDEDMRVTFYGNYFYNINSRQPLFRYGKGHILNNYFDAGTQSDSASCINVRAGSELYIEGNTFANFSKETGDSLTNGTYIIGFFFTDSTKTYGTVSGKWTSVSNNNYNTNYGSSSYKPLYNYTAASYPTSAPTSGTDVGVGCNLSY